MNCYQEFSLTELSMSAENRLESLLLSSDGNESFGMLSEKLLDYQLSIWDLAKNNFNALNEVETKSFEDKNGIVFRIQFNPHRINSTAAKTDPQSIANRKCFLCLENLPKEQKGVSIIENYLILVNPYPIAPKHFTITNLSHQPQLIDKSFGDLLTISELMNSNYLVFYNGPKCGASAPDHLHFQSVEKKFLPFYEFSELLLKKFSDVVFQNSNISVLAYDDNYRKAIILKSEEKVEILSYFKELLKVISKIDNYDQEPMLNILVIYDNGNYEVTIFLRKKHRPDRFYSENEDNLIISPASIDLAGVLITPRKEDFEKISLADIESIFQEVYITKEGFEYVKKSFSDLNGL